MEVGKKKSLAFDIRHDFKQKSKPFDVYDNVLVLYIHRNREMYTLEVNKTLTK